MSHGDDRLAIARERFHRNDHKGALRELWYVEAETRGKSAPQRLAEALALAVSIRDSDSSPRRRREAENLASMFERRQGALVPRYRTSFAIGFANPTRARVEVAVQAEGRLAAESELCLLSLYAARQIANLDSESARVLADCLANIGGDGDVLRVLGRIGVGDIQISGGRSQGGLVFEAVLCHGDTIAQAHGPSELLHTLTFHLESRGFERRAGGFDYYAPASVLRAEC